MRIIFAIILYMSPLAAFGQVAGTQCGRLEAVVENAANAERTTVQLDRIRDRLARASGADPATLTNAQACVAALQFVRFHIRSTVGSQAQAEQAAAVNAAVNQAETDLD